jgi:hypothetical protein
MKTGKYYRAARFHDRWEIYPLHHKGRKSSALTGDKCIRCPVSCTSHSAASASHTSAFCCAGFTSFSFQSPGHGLNEVAAAVRERRLISLLRAVVGIGLFRSYHGSKMTNPWDDSSPVLVERINPTAASFCGVYPLWDSPRCGIDSSPQYRNSHPDFHRFFPIYTGASFTPSGVLASFCSMLGVLRSSSICQRLGSAEGRV